MKEAIGDFARPLHRCKVIITCREYAYKGGDAWRLPEAQFPVIDLPLFQEEQIRQFAQTWYQVMGPRLEWDAAQQAQKGKRLAEAVLSKPHLRELGQYPLLLTLMAQVHVKHDLPENRTELYDLAVNLLLSHGWLSDKLGQTIALPHEYEWEVAARWPDGRYYPWGNEFDSAKANTREGNIGRPTAVGLYPSGKNAALDLYDLSGNVLEWCRNRDDKPESDMDPTGVDMSRASRVLRGGSWANLRVFARGLPRRLHLRARRLRFSGGGGGSSPISSS